MIARVIEPCFSRRLIIKVIVWVLDWVSVQVIKTITVSCKGQSSVNIQTARECPQMTLWRGYHACDGGH